MIISQNFYSSPSLIICFFQLTPGIPFCQNFSRNQLLISAAFTIVRTKQPRQTQKEGPTPMKQASDLQNMLHSIHRKSYPAYKCLKGIYQFDRYILSIDHVQGDPFASPSHISVRILHKDAGFPKEYYQEKIARITLCDFLTRQFEQQVNRYTFRAKGSGKSGLISVTHCGQEVLERTACEITEKGITARFFIGFPANGRTINAPELEKILFDFLPVCVQKAFFYRNLNHSQLEQAIFLAEDQAWIRRELERRSLAAFVADGSVLPRESGISSRPMKDSIPFSSPKTLRITMDLPHKGTITGMGIPTGITLIAGGGYHGKSTLLNALELGVYNHIPGDGREYVITDETALKLRSEDGRFVKDADISLFINDLPNQKTPAVFLRRMPAEVLLRQPESWKAWNPEAAFSCWMKTLQPPISWYGMHSCRKSSKGKRNPSHHFWNVSEIFIGKQAFPRFW